MAHWRERFKETDKHLGSVDLWDDEKKSYFSVEVTIEKFVNDKLVGAMGEENKTFVKFKEFPKMMVMNKTNFKRCSKLFSSVDENDYIGKKITLGVESVRDPQGGGNVDALRISTRAAKQTAATKELPVLTPDTLKKAVNLVKTGAKTLDWVKENYAVTPEQLEELTIAKGV